MSLCSTYTTLRLLVSGLRSGQAGCSVTLMIIDFTVAPA
jgi:hypothetical protein